MPILYSGKLPLVYVKGSNEDVIFTFQAVVPSTGPVSSGGKKAWDANTMASVPSLTGFSADVMIDPSPEEPTNKVVKAKVLASVLETVAVGSYLIDIKPTGASYAFRFALDVKPNPNTYINSSLSSLTNAVVSLSNAVTNITVTGGGGGSPGGRIF